MRRLWVMAVALAFVVGTTALAQQQQQQSGQRSTTTQQDEQRSTTTTQPQDRATTSTTEQRAAASTVPLAQKCSALAREVTQHETDMRQDHQQLQQLLQQMNSASGTQKTDATAKAVQALAEHVQMEHREASEMHPRILQHIADHLTQPQGQVRASIEQCPLFQNWQKKTGAQQTRGDSDANADRTQTEQTSAEERAKEILREQDEKKESTPRPPQF